MKEKEENKSNPTEPTENIQEKLDECQKQCGEYLEGWKRAKADFINYKNDEAVRMENIVKFGNESFLYDLLSVLDSLDVGIMTLEKDTDAHKGMKLIHMQLEDVMKRHGLELINAPPGTKFNPAYHEAIEEIESDMPEGTIAEEVKRGYALHGKVIRPSKVKIAKKA